MDDVRMGEHADDGGPAGALALHLTRGHGLPDEPRLQQLLGATDELPDLNRKDLRGNHALVEELDNALQA